MPDYRMPVFVDTDLRADGAYRQLAAKEAPVTKRIDHTDSGGCP